MNAKKKALIEAIKDSPARSQWDKAVKVYALELVEKGEWLPKADYEYWKRYSRCGRSLIYDEDIAKRVCTPSELKKTKNGRLAPNSRESWLDVQARALHQANRLFVKIVKEGGDKYLA